MVNSCACNYMNISPYLQCNLATMPRGIAIWKPCQPISLQLAPFNQQMPINSMSFNVSHILGLYNPDWSVLFVFLKHFRSRMSLLILHLFINVVLGKNSRLFLASEFQSLGQELLASEFQSELLVVISFQFLYVTEVPNPRVRDVSRHQDLDEFKPKSKNNAHIPISKVPNHITQPGFGNNSFVTICIYKMVKNMPKFCVKYFD